VSNPRLKKNPFMSMWLSGFNAAAGSMRGHTNEPSEAPNRERDDSSHEGHPQGLDSNLAPPPAKLVGDKHSGLVMPSIPASRMKALGGLASELTSKPDRSWDPDVMAEVTFAALRGTEGSARHTMDELHCQNASMRFVDTRATARCEIHASRPARGPGRSASAAFRQWLQAAPRGCAA